MPARTGAQYIQGLKERNLEVWIDGQRITDVTTFPGFRRGIGTMAALYDMQHDPETSEEMTYVSPTSGDRVGLSYLTPKEQGDLERRSRMVRHWAMGSAGMMGRTPDYVNVSLMAMAAAEGYFAQGRPELARNMQLLRAHTRERFGAHPFAGQLPAEPVAVAGTSRAFRGADAACAQGDGCWPHRAGVPAAGHAGSHLGRGRCVPHSSATEDGAPGTSCSRIRHTQRYARPEVRVPGELRLRPFTLRPPLGVAVRGDGRHRLLSRRADTLGAGVPVRRRGPMRRT